MSLDDVIDTMSSITLANLILDIESGESGPLERDILQRARKALIRWEGSFMAAEMIADLRKDGNKRIEELANHRKDRRKTKATDTP